MNKKQADKKDKEDLKLNRQLEGNDKYPGEEEGKAEKVTNDDLKGKTVDGDPDDPKDQPLER
jgi:hypothetical protein